MTANELTQILNRGCTSGVTAIRSITRLQPAGGAGDKVFPPTYADGTYAFERRIIDGKRVDTVLLDSVQSRANRFEEALLDAYRSGRFVLPVFEMKVGEHELTSLTVPHRVHDAILRDSLWAGKPFRESDNGKRLVSARAWNATPFFEYAPTVLLFGTWDSQSGGGVNTAKIARSLISEIIAIDAERGVRTSSRIDPLGIKRVGDVVMKTEEADIWRFVEPSTDGKKTKEKSEAKLVRPSEVNHGNVTPTITDPQTGPGGVTFREAIDTTVLSLTQIRKLRFPDGDGVTTPARDIAGRTVVAALGVYAVSLSQDDGYQLRSRCHLLPMEASQFELIGRTEKERERFELDSSTAEAALTIAIETAEKHGLKWHPGRIELQPRPDLVRLVEFSDRAMAVGQGE